MYVALLVDGVWSVYIIAWVLSHCQVLDNCPMHYTYLESHLLPMVASRGALLRFLAPYCPGDNPIEPCFNQLKSFLRRWGDWAEANDEEQVIDFALRNCVSAEQAANFYRGCGYSVRPDLRV